MREKGMVMGNEDNKIERQKCMTPTSTSPITLFSGIPYLLLASFDEAAVHDTSCGRLQWGSFEQKRLAQGIPLVIVTKPVGADATVLLTSDDILPSSLPASGNPSFPLLGKGFVGLGVCTIDVVGLVGAAKSLVNIDTLPCTSSP